MYDVMKVPNFGQEDYVIYENIAHVEQNKSTLRELKMATTPYECKINENSELSSLIYHIHKHSKFKKYITPFNLTKVSKKKKGFNFVVYGYNIKQSLLSYTIQNKVNLYNIFNVVKSKEIDMMVVMDFKKMMHDKKLIDGKYNMKTFSKSQTLSKKPIMKKIVISDKKIYIDDLLYYHKYVLGNSLIYRLEHYTVNNYDMFVELLENFYKTVNGNCDWDKYLNGEVKRLLMTNNELKVRELDDKLNKKLNKISV